MLRCCSGLLMAITLLAGFGGVEAQEAAKKARVLMLTQSKGFTHGSVKRPADKLAPSEIAMTQLAETSGLFTINCTQDAAADITKENLQKYDVVAFYTTGDLPITPENRDYFFKEWLQQKGHGFLGFHSATDTLGNYQPYWDFVGGTFNGHPWGSGETVTISVHDTSFPAMKPLGAEFEIKDEIYQYKNYQPEKVRVLMSLNMAKCKTKKPYMVPVAWVKEYGEGRLFYTNLGHNEGTWTNKMFLEHVTGGLRWVLRQEEGDAKPNPDFQKQLEEKAKTDVEGSAK